MAFAQAYVTCDKARKFPSTDYITFLMGLIALKISYKCACVAVSRAETALPLSTSKLIPCRKYSVARLSPDGSEIFFPISQMNFLATLSQIQMSRIVKGQNYTLAKGGGILAVRVHLR